MQQKNFLNVPEISVVLFSSLSCQKNEKKKNDEDRHRTCSVASHCILRSIDCTDAPPSNMLMRRQLNNGLARENPLFGFSIGRLRGLISETLLKSNAFFKKN